jgi:hypothetical protein
MTFLGAIAARLEGNIAGLTGGAWVDQWAEPLPDLPVITYGSDDRREHLLSVPDGFPYTDEGPTIFLVWHKGLAAADALSETVHGLLKNQSDWDDLSGDISPLQVISIIRTGKKVAAENVRHPDGSQVYRVELSYEIRISGID